MYQSNIFSTGLAGTVAVILAGALSACGGGSSGSDSNEAASGGISEACVRTGNDVVVTRTGCLTEFGNNTQTVACSSPKTIHILTGTGWTLDQLLQSGSKTTGTGQFGFNNLTLRCV